MLDHSEWARRCRALSKSATDPEVIEQLLVWATEFANAAGTAARRARPNRHRKTLPRDAE
jgi:hypothetical protein